MPRKDRSRPRYGSFLFSGGLVGLVISIVVLRVFDGTAGDRGRGQLSILLTLMLIGTGALLAGALAVLLEGRHAATSTGRDNVKKRPSDP